LRNVGEPVDQGLGYWLFAPTPQWRQAKVKRLVEQLVA
jgi:LysR family glycine cleavage system transcriptional activator